MTFTLSITPLSRAACEAIDACPCKRHRINMRKTNRQMVVQLGRQVHVFVLTRRKTVRAEMSAN